MELTLQQAATALGKTRRQVQYLIQQGHLAARKVGGRWYVDSAALGDDPQVAQRSQYREARLRDAVNDALSPGPAQRRYSLTDLKAFQILLPFYRRLQQTGGAEHPATCHLKSALEHLAQGCHRFGRAEKAASYQAARDAVSLAVLELVLDPGLQEAAADLEDAFMGAVAGLLRRVDSKRGDWS